MAKDLVIIDSCVLIKAFRKDPEARKDLESLLNHTAYSVITHLELLYGANTFSKKEAVNKIFQTYFGIPLNQVISTKAIQIMQTYVSGQQIITIPDCLIAATALITGYPLLTYNKKDFSFIDGLVFFK